MVFEDHPCRILYNCLHWFILQDWRELSMKLSDITVNMHTSSELLRMSLRRSDHEHISEEKDDEQSNFSDSSDEEDDDVVRMIRIDRKYENKLVLGI